METNGLAHVSMLLPEIQDADVYASTAIDRAVAEMTRQFYPDGCQTELASSYGRLSMLCSFCTLKLAELRGFSTKHGLSIAPELWLQLRNMGDVYARIAAPDGRVPGLHDCDGVQVAEMYRDLAALPVATELPPSPWQEKTGITQIPWGGYGVLRGEGRWSMLDGGPWGTGHQHSDALQVITWSDGDFWCLDPGKPVYNQSPETQLIRSSEGHNVVLMDGSRHLPQPQIWRASTPMPMAVVAGDGVSVAAAGRSARLVGAESHVFSHERLLLNIAGLDWLVVDRLWAGDQQAHVWEWLWHLPAGTDVDLTDFQAIARRKDGRKLAFSIASTAPFTFDVAVGQAEPLRGWRVSGRGEKEAQAIPVIAGKTAENTGPVFTATFMTCADWAVTDLALTPTAAGRQVTALVQNQPFSLNLVGHKVWTELTVSWQGRETMLVLPAHCLYAE